MITERAIYVFICFFTHLFRLGHIHGFYVLVRQREIKKDKKMDKRMRGQKFGSLGHRH
jgi:hypothetical protein